MNGQTANQRLLSGGDIMSQGGYAGQAQQSRLLWPSPMGIATTTVEGQVTGVYDPQRAQGFIDEQHQPPPTGAVEQARIQPSRSRRLSGVSAEYLGEI